VNAFHNIFHVCINMIHKFILKSICNCDDFLIPADIFLSPPLAGLDVKFVKIVCCEICILLISQYSSEHTLQMALR
jgi:hypothetical protein